MARVYVSGSVYDLPRVRAIQATVRNQGHEITHDWTAYDGSKDNYDEALRQLRGVWDAEVVVVAIHPRLKAGWMELGAAVAYRIPVIVVPHPAVRPSMWYSLSWVHMASMYGLGHDIAAVTPVD